MVVKNCANEPWLNYTPTIIFEDYMKAKYSLIEENYDLIKEDDLFE
jgi:hypothetical protein